MKGLSDTIISRSTALVLFTGAFLFAHAWIHVVIVKQDQFSYICNTGIGLGVEMAWIPFFVVWTLLVAFLLFMLYTWVKNGVQWIYVLGLYLMILGALGNYIDRIIYGCVIDHIPFLNIFYFNIADVCIAVGAVIIVYKLFKSDQLKKS